MAEHNIEIGASSNVASVTWDDESLDLIVTFRHGGGGRYIQVTGEDAYGFERAPSPGRYLNDVIIPAYQYERL